MKIPNVVLRAVSILLYRTKHCYAQLERVDRDGLILHMSFSCKICRALRYPNMLLTAQHHGY